MGKEICQGSVGMQGGKGPRRPCIIVSMCRPCERELEGGEGWGHQRGRTGPASPLPSCHRGICWREGGRGRRTMFRVWAGRDNQKGHRNRVPREDLGALSNLRL